jgi:hypothetical protein
VRKFASLLLAAALGAGGATVPATPALAAAGTNTVTVDVSMRIIDVDPIGRDEKGTRTFSGTVLVSEDAYVAALYPKGCVDDEVSVRMQIAVYHGPSMNRPAGSVEIRTHAMLDEGTRCYQRTVGEERETIVVRANETATRSFWIHNAGPGRDRAKITYTITNRVRS